MERPEFEQLALEHLDSVFRMALHLARNQTEAEDIVQEVFARAFRPTSIQGFQPGEDPPTAMRAWLFTITHNVFLTRLKQASRRATPVADFFDATDNQPPPDEPPPLYDGQTLDWEQVDSRIKTAIDDLKPEFREVLLMWAVEGLKYREIAAILDVPIGTIMSRLHRARKILTDHLLQDPQTADDLGLRRLGNPDPEHLTR
ncbi:MAG: sigma-70 family RNA polymerase sigma factor [Phycisphaeraceae bacterium]|nr:sigma-70 family RNA polymerase sigma factor [Phycisphaeraceae bacterium]MCW5755412.1 sigma-70 family RNA polymerase sigma factor [Phycisphaeraceae bacterium]